MITTALQRAYASPALYAKLGQVTLRPYQQEIAEAIVKSVQEKAGLTFTVAISRQGGKNEVQAAIQAYLLSLMRFTDAQLVIAAPTYKPQVESAMRRLARALDRNPLTRGKWHKESGYIFRVGQARALFFSAQPEANVVGATASVLLNCDEAQDVLPEKWDKDFSPMGAAYNVTTVFFGTVWTSDTLLAREMQAARAAEQADGRKRVFFVTAEQVGQAVPDYARYVQTQVQRLGREHPLIKSQYFLEQIDAQGGLFTPIRRALMRGDHPQRESALEGRIYALTVDVAGADEDKADTPEARNREQRRDSTAITVYEADLSQLDDLHKPVWRVQTRYILDGVPLTAQSTKIAALVETWRAQWAVVDATGLGAGLASMLIARLGADRVKLFVFSAQTKSQLLWDFVAIVDGGRYKDHAQTRDPHQQRFWREVEATQYQVIPGPGRLARWGVPDGKRDPNTGALMHDDTVMSAALVAVLDGLDWQMLPATAVDIGEPITQCLALWEANASVYGLVLMQFTGGLKVLAEFAGYPPAEHGAELGFCHPDQAEARALLREAELPIRGVSFRPDDHAAQIARLVATRRLLVAPNCTTTAVQLAQAGKAADKPYFCALAAFLAVRGRGL